MQFDKKLTVVMPAYNEGAQIYVNIVELVHTIRDFAPVYEVIIVDDGSRDNTVSEVIRASMDEPYIKVIVVGKNSGKGEALKIGTASAENEGYIAFIDADLDLHPRQIESFYDIMQKKNADVVIGSKMHKHSRVDYPARRKMMSLGYYFILRILFRLNVHDTQTGLKLFKADVIKFAMERILVKRFAFDIEVLSICNSKRHVITEAPIELIFSRCYSRIGVIDVIRVILDTLAIFYRLKIIKYYDREIPEKVADTLTGEKSAVYRKNDRKVWR